jgi:hypothetical protein
MSEQPSICPNCHQPGSLQVKMVKNAYGSVYHYPYFAHYAGLKETNGRKWRKVKWCYVGKKGKTSGISQASTRSPKAEQAKVPVTVQIPAVRSQDS